MRNKGFTLVEVVIYIALFGILMVGAVVATYQLLQGGAHNETALAVQEEGMFLVRKINWALTSVSSVSVSPDGTILTISKIPSADFLSTDNPLLIYASGGTLSLKRGSADATILNSAAFPVDTFTAQSSVSSGQTNIAISMSIKGIPFLYKTYLR
ncbi:MAG: hypothetical protein RLZZ347_418 [Candidatus Parcubacteria bacterium]|jgi:prepilin-type N-terminal cleavage/methylation domain-containing protein